MSLSTLPSLETAPSTSASRVSPPSLDVPLTIIERRALTWRGFSELWRYRELLFFLVLRDVKLRYRQTALGAAWAVLQPLTAMVVFAIFLGRVGHVGASPVPYPLFVLAGLVPWIFFANAISGASHSLIGSQQLLSKVYFPRLVIPAAVVCAFLLDLIISLGVVAVLMIYYGVAPGTSIAALPVAFLGIVVAALAFGVLLSALTVGYRDFRHVVPFMVQLWMFATPAIYLPSAAYDQSRWRSFLALNPAQGLIATFRAALFGESVSLAALLTSFGVAVGVLIVGCAYFRHVERSLADII